MRCPQTASAQLLKTFDDAQGLRIPREGPQGPWKSVESTSGGNKLCCDQAHHRSTTNIIYVQIGEHKHAVYPKHGGYKTNHWDCLKMSHTQMIPVMYVEFYWLKSFDVPLDVFNPSYLRVQQRQPLLWNAKALVDLTSTPRTACRPIAR